MKFINAARDAALTIFLIGCTSSNVTPTLTREELLDPQTCRTCHEDHYRDWSGSMHAYAGRDPVFLAMNKRAQRETQGAVGSLCVGCHAPMAVREGVTTDGLNLESVPEKLQGVTCYFCHTVDAVEGTHNNPLRLTGGTELRGELHDAFANTGHTSAYSTLHDRDRAESATMCGSCHDIAPNHAGPTLERTFIEWQESVFSKPGGATCSQCHMDQSTDLRPVAQVPGAPSRRYHSHTFAGVDVALVDDFPEKETQRQEVEAFLATTLQSALCVAPVGGASGSAIRVILDNVAAGHGFPSGAAPNRRIWTEITAYQDGRVIYQSGTAENDQPIVKAADADTWLLRDCLFDDAGKEVSMLWNASDHESNALPAQITFDATDPMFYQSHRVQNFPRAQGTFINGVPDRVTLRVHVQPVGTDILDDLIASGDLDPAVRNTMPTFDIDLGGDTTLEWKADSTNGKYTENGVLTFSCITKTNLNVAASKTPAVNKTRCSP